MPSSQKLNNDPQSVSSIKPMGDLERVIDLSWQNLDYAYSKRIMTLYARPTETAGRSVKLRDGQVIVDFARGSYLGLDNHPAIVQGAISALEDYRSLQWSGARTRLNFAIMEELETRLSEFFQARSLVFSLVLTANMAVMPLMASGAFTDGKRPIVIFDKFCHATLSYHKASIAANTEVITIGHNDIGALERLCKTHDTVAYVADGVYSMGGSAPIDDLLRLQDKYGLFLYIDDAHGISIQGNRGEGYARSRLGASLRERTIGGIIE